MGVKCNFRLKNTSVQCQDPETPKEVDWKGMRALEYSRGPSALRGGEHVCDKLHHPRCQALCEIFVKGFIGDKYTVVLQLLEPSR